QAVRPTAILVLGVGLALAPLVLRNVLVGAPPLALANRAAEAIIEGNAADTVGSGMHVPPSMGGILEGSGGRLGAGVQRTLGTYQGNWRQFADVQLIKIKALADPLEVPNNLDFYYGREISPILLLLPGYGVLFPLAVAGLVMTLGWGPRHRLLILYVLGSTASLSAALVLARYRMILVPSAAIFGAAGLVRASDAARQRETGRVLVYATLVGGAVILQQMVAPVWALRDDPAAMVHSIEYGAAAQLYVEAGRFDRALGELERLRR